VPDRLAADFFPAEPSEAVLTGRIDFADEAAEVGFALLLSRAGKSSD
jgi:hypothetical protein